MMTAPSSALTPTQRRALAAELRREYDRLMESAYNASPAERVTLQLEVDHVIYQLHRLGARL